MAGFPARKDDCWIICMTGWTGIITISDTRLRDLTIAREGAGIATNTGGGNTGIIIHIVPMDITIPAMTIIAFPAPGFSRGDSFPYLSVEIEIAFKAKLGNMLEIHDL